MPPPSSTRVSGSPNLYANIVRDSLTQNKDFVEVYGLAKEVTKGKLYVVGSVVYKSIIGAIYGRDVVINDIDLLVEQILPEVCPDGWKRKGTKFTKNDMRTHNCTSRCTSDLDGTIHDYNNDTIVPGTSTEMMPLQSICHEAQREPSLENYLDTVPFTVQSIAYDLQQHRVLGDAGINAIRSQTVAVQDLFAAKRYVNILERRRQERDAKLMSDPAWDYGPTPEITLTSLLRKKAQELGFAPRTDRCLCAPCILHEQVSSTVNNMLK